MDSFEKQFMPNGINPVGLSVKYSTIQSRRTGKESREMVASYSEDYDRMITICPYAWYEEAKQEVMGKIREAVKTAVPLDKGKQRDILGEIGSMGVSEIIANTSNGIIESRGVKIRIDSSHEHLDRYEQFKEKLKGFGYWPIGWL